MTSAAGSGAALIALATLNRRRDGLRFTVLDGAIATKLDNYNNGLLCAPHRN